MVALFFSYCIVLEARILGLLQTLSVFIKIRSKAMWVSQYDFTEVEDTFSKGLASQTEKVETQLKAFDNTIETKPQEPFGLSGVGEGVILNAIQLDKDNKVCSCPTTGVHKVYNNKTSAEVAKFSDEFLKHSYCSGDVYDCERGGHEYTFCFPEELDKKRFKRYKGVQVGSGTDTKIYPNGEMPEESDCSAKFQGTTA